MLNMRFATGLHVVGWAWVVGCAHPNSEIGSGTTGGAQSVGGSTASGGTSNSLANGTSSMGTPLGGQLSVGGSLAGGAGGTNTLLNLGGTAAVGGSPRPAGAASSKAGAPVNAGGTDASGRFQVGGASGAVGESLGSAASSIVIASAGTSTQAGTSNVGSGGSTAVSGGSTATGGTTRVSTVTAVSNPKADFTEQVGDVTFDMVYVPGGTFTLGCESESCPAYTTPVSNVKVSSYYIGKVEVTTALYNTVMDWSSSGTSRNITWYDAAAFACQLGKKTGRKYRMMTEAEFEYAAKKYSSQLEQLGAGEEWAYNSFETTYSCQPGATDPVGPNSGAHVQKTLRDVAETGDATTGRRIRSIDGVGPALRLAISDEVDFPPNYLPPCDHYVREPDPNPYNSYRDPRWVTGSEAHWTTGTIAIGNFDLRVWQDGTARFNNKDGQWFTSNNIAFVFVPSAGSSIRFPYIFLDATQGSLISDTSFMSSGYVGRIVKKSADSYVAPTVPGLKSGAELAAAAGDDFKMLNMEELPESAKQQDPRLLDGPDACWFQNNISNGGTFNYRKDVDAQEFRFAVIDKGQVEMLASGSWFTVNNTLLRIKHSTGYVTDYLYTLTSDRHFFHLSYQSYERGELRMFQEYSNTTGNFPATCLNYSCSSELPKGAAVSRYANMESGKSTYVPAPCPGGGCE